MHNKRHSAVMTHTHCYVITSATDVRVCVKFRQKMNGSSMLCHGVKGPTICQVFLASRCRIWATHLFSMGREKIFPGHLDHAESRGDSGCSSSTSSKLLPSEVEAVVRDGSIHTDSI